MSQEQFIKDLDKVLVNLRTLLIDKNRKYGDAALNPVRIMSKANAVEQLKVRMDDKLNRIMNQQTDEDEDVLKDLFGYLAIYHVALARLNSQTEATEV